MSEPPVAVPARFAEKAWSLIRFELVVADDLDFMKVFTDSLMAGIIRE